MNHEPTPNNEYPQTPPPPPPAPVATTVIEKPRTPWAALVSTAAATALVTSMITTGIVATPSNDSAAIEPTSQPTTSTALQVSSAGDTNWAAVAEQVSDSVVAIDVTSSQGTASGSGVIIDTDGHILTNNHVVSGAVDDTVKVTLADATVINATIVGLDAATDLAVIKLETVPDDLVAAPLADSSEVIVGQPVMAVGNPLGLSNTVTIGVVSAVNRPVSAGSSEERSVTAAIQIDAAINPGNSGGPLFDATGSVIGITSSIATLSQGLGQSGSIGLGFAIPSNLASSVAEQLIETGSVAHAFLGVLPSDTTTTLGEITRTGAKVESVVEGSPAANAGLAAGDVIIGFNDFSVTGEESLTAFVRGARADDDVSITYIRDGESHTVSVTLASREDSATQNEQDEPTEPTEPSESPRDPGREERSWPYGR